MLVGDVRSHRCSGAAVLGYVMLGYVNVGIFEKMQQARFCQHVGVKKIASLTSCCQGGS